VTGERVNILYIHSHDTGRYIQPYGYAVPTPHLQQLAEQGTLFRKAFCASPTCSPSRACLMTGQWAHCNGMFGLAHRGFRATDYSHWLPHTLKKVGHVTALAGIQHEAQLPTADPRLLGYDRLLNHDAQGACFVERTVEAAVDFFSKVQAPFFLSVGFIETHRNFPAPGPGDNPNYVLPPSRLPDMPEIRGDMAGYVTMARHLDDDVGAILSALETRSLAGQTLVIYTTDHGIAFPGMKCTLSDHGLGVALIIRGPGGFDGGRVCDAMVTHLDLFPTICELAQVPAPSWLQGNSLVALGVAERLSCTMPFSPRSITIALTNRSVVCAPRASSSFNTSTSVPRQCWSTVTTARANPPGWPPAGRSNYMPRTSCTT